MKNLLPVDPVTQQNLMLGIITLVGALSAFFSALAVWIQQKNAAAGKARSEVVAQQLALHNTTVTQKLDSIESATNGRLENLSAENATLKAQVAAK